MGKDILKKGKFAEYEDLRSKGSMKVYIKDKYDDGSYEIYTVEKGTKKMTESEFSEMIKDINKKYRLINKEYWKWKKKPKFGY